MSSIADNIGSVLEQLPEGVTLMAVTKGHTPAEIMEAYNAGLRIFGENRVQELVSKKEQLPDDISWHLIGRLQSNKVRQAVTAATMIESVDSVRLLQLIDQAATARDVAPGCLLQVHIADEETKSGFSIGEISGTDWGQVAASLRSVRIRGVMGMATFTDDREKVRAEFRKLAELFRMLREKYFSNDHSFNVISMGMSGDWQIAVGEGSTLVRIGTLIFGERIR